MAKDISEAKLITSFAKFLLICWVGLPQNYAG
jgi:hypothetical protein